MAKTTNPVEICNLALAELNQRLISTLDGDGGTPQQMYCKLVYDQARRALLAAYDWSFALARESIAPDKLYTQNEDLLDKYPNLYTDQYYGWYGQYRLPADCLKISAVYDSNWRKVVNTRGIAMPWTRRGNYIYLSESCGALGNEGGPRLNLQYVADQEDVNLFSPAFCEALYLSIAKRLTKQFNNSASFLQVLEIKFEKAFKEAKIQDFRQTNTEGVISAPMMEEMYGSI